MLSLLNIYYTPNMLIDEKNIYILACILMIELIINEINETNIYLIYSSFNFLNNANILIK